MSVDEMAKVVKVSGKDPSAFLHEPDCAGMKACDDIMGQELSPALMVKARRDEIKYLRNMGVCEEVSARELECRWQSACCSQMGGHQEGEVSQPLTTVADSWPKS